MMMHWTRLVVLASFLLAVSLNFKLASTCIGNAPPMNDTAELGALEADHLHSLTMFLSDYSFSCNGTVKQWRVRWDLKKIKMCTIIIDFYVLRLSTKDDSSCGISSVGMNSFILQSDQDNELPLKEGVFNVSKDDALEVMSGDRIGLTVSLNDNMGGCSAEAKLTILESIDTNSLSIIYYNRQQEQQSSGISADFNDGLNDFLCDSHNTNRKSFRKRFDSEDETTRTKTTKTRTTEPCKPRTEKTRTEKTRTNRTRTDRTEADRPRPRIHRARPCTDMPSIDATPLPHLPDPPMPDQNEIAMYIGAPLITAIVGEITSDSVIQGSGQLEEQEKDGSRSSSNKMVMIVPSVTVVAGLLVVLSAIIIGVVVLWLCYRSQKKRTKNSEESEKGDISVNLNLAYSATSPSTSLPQPVVNHKTVYNKNRKSVGEKHPMKPSGRISKTTAVVSRTAKDGDNTQYVGIPTLKNMSYDEITTHERTKEPTVHVESELDYIVMESVGRYEGNKYIVDGDVYEIPCVN